MVMGVYEECHTIFHNRRYKKIRIEFECFLKFVFCFISLVSYVCAVSIRKGSWLQVRSSWLKLFFVSCRFSGSGPMYCFNVLV